jgi:D-alanyl-D-alanine dipeptidase
MTMPDETATGNSSSSIILMGDPRVTAIPVSDNSEELTDVRDHGLRVSPLRADDAGDFAHVRAGLAARLLRAAGELPRGVHLLLIEGYRPPALQRRYFDNYLRSLRTTTPESDDVQLRMLASRYVSPPEIAPHSAGAAIDLTLCTDDGTQLDLGTPVNATPEQSAGACYTHHPSVDGEARRNRATLAEALRTAGLVNYPTEWWHWSGLSASPVSPATPSSWPATRRQRPDWPTSLPTWTKWPTTMLSQEACPQTHHTITEHDLRSLAPILETSARMPCPARVSQ